MTGYSATLGPSAHSRHYKHVLVIHDRFSNPEPACSEKEVSGKGRSKAPPHVGHSSACGPRGTLYKSAHVWRTAQDPFRMGTYFSPGSCVGRAHIHLRDFVWDSVLSVGRYLETPRSREPWRNQMAANERLFSFGANRKAGSQSPNLVWNLVPKSTKLETPLNHLALLDKIPACPILERKGTQKSSSLPRHSVCAIRSAAQPWETLDVNPTEPIAKAANPRVSGSLELFWLDLFHSSPLHQVPSAGPHPRQRTHPHSVHPI